VVWWAAPWHERSPGKAPPSLEVDAPFRRYGRSLKRLPAPEAQLRSRLSMPLMSQPSGSKRLPRTQAESTPPSTPLPLITSRAFRSPACLWRTSTRSPVESPRDLSAARSARRADESPGPRSNLDHHRRRSPAGLSERKLRLGAATWSRGLAPVTAVRPLRMSARGALRRQALRMSATRYEW